MQQSHWSSLLLTSVLLAMMLAGCQLESSPFINPLLPNLVQSLDTNQDGVVSEMEWMQAVDTNQDGQYTREEVPAGLESLFDVIDANGNGVADPVEVAVLLAYYNELMG